MTVTTLTLTKAVERAITSLSTNFGFIGVGTDGTVYSDGQTDLLAEVFTSLLEDLNIFTGAIVFAIRVPATQADGVSLLEVGIFDAVTGGNMGSRDVLVGSLRDVEEQWIDVMVQVTAEAI